MHRNIGYDPVRAFTPVALLITAPLILTVHSSLPVNTVGELVHLILSILSILSAVAVDEPWLFG